MQFEPAWHVLDCDDKARWVPEDHRAVLMADAIWAPLLVQKYSAKAKVAKTEK